MAGGTVIGTAYVNIVPKVDKGFGTSVTRAVSGIDGTAAGRKIGSQVSGGISASISKGSAAIAGALGGLASTAFSGLISGIMNLSGEMVEAADGAQKFATTLEFAGIDTSTIDQLTASTQAYADQTVYELNDIRNVTAQLAANGVANYAQLAEAAGNLNAVAGGNADTFRSVGMVMTQTAGSGKLMTENWNQLTDAIPGASGALQEAMRSAGAFEGNFREAMENGEISADEFFQAVQKLGMQDVAVEAATSTSTIEGAMGNLRASIVGVGAQVVTGITPVLTGAMTQLSTWISQIPTLFTGIGEAMSPFVEQIASMAAPAFETLGTALSNMGATLLPLLQQAFTAIQPILTAVGSVVSTVLGAAFSFVANVMTTVISLFTAAASVVLPMLSAAFQALAPVVETVFGAIQTVIGTVMGVINTIVSAGMAVLQGDWEGAWEIVSQALNDAWEGIKQAVSDAIESLGEKVAGIKDTVLGALSDAGSWLLGVGEDIISGLWDGISGALGWLGEKLGGIADFVVSHKGPPEYDAKLLIPTGKLIMGGLIDGIDSMKSELASTLEDVTKTVGFANPINVDGGIFEAGFMAQIDQQINFNQPIATPAQTAAMMKRYATYGLAGAR